MAYICGKPHGLTSALRRTVLTGAASDFVFSDIRYRTAIALNVVKVASIGHTPQGDTS